MNKHSYSPTTISTYQVISAYFVDIYYNHLYTEAIKFKNSAKVKSITDGYRHAVFAFLSAIDSKSSTYNPKHYKHILISINNYFTTYTSFSTLTLSDCIDKITKEFIPVDYHNTLSKDHKRHLLRQTIVNVIRAFTKIVVTQFLTPIIDNHSDVSNIDAMKDSMVNLLLLERESLYNKFVNVQIGNESVDKSIALKMQSYIKKLLGERKVMLKHMQEYKSQANLRTKQLQEVVTKFKRLKHQNNTYKEEIKIMRTQLATQPVYEPMMQSSEFLSPGLPSGLNNMQNNMQSNTQSNTQSRVPSVVSRTVTAMSPSEDLEMNQIQNLVSGGAGTLDEVNATSEQLVVDKNNPITINDESEEESNDEEEIVIDSNESNIESSNEPLPSREEMDRTLSKYTRSKKKTPTPNVTIRNANSDSDSDNESVSIPPVDKLKKAKKAIKTNMGNPPSLADIY